MSLGKSLRAAARHGLRCYNGDWGELLDDPFAAPGKKARPVDPSCMMLIDVVSFFPPRFLFLDSFPSGRCRAGIACLQAGRVFSLELAQEQPLWH